jgi:CopA family copper-resistance protein
MWNQMRMMPTDFSDVTASRNISGALRYLINGATAEMNWTGLFRPGERVRLRFINGAATTIFDVRIPGLKMTVVSADGQDVEPVTVDEFRISVAETYDVIVQPREDQAYTIFAQSIGRSGFVRATLAPRPGMLAPVPNMDEAQWLSMTDMMGAMAMSGMHGSATGGHAMGGHAQQAGASPPAATAGAAHQGHDMPMATQTDPHAAHAQMPTAAAPTAGHPPKVTHARTEYGPGVDMHVDMPRTNLDDPGVNLRDNGRRVLTYADLRTIGGPVDPREPSREIELHLTGNMERFMWSFDGQKFSESLPIRFRFGERLRIVLVNDTMMNHPIHLHGMWSELESPDGKFQVRKHTINVQPAQRITYRVTADAPGHWAYHCHLLYHMEAGMFREVVVS